MPGKEVDSSKQLLVTVQTVNSYDIVIRYAVRSRRELIIYE